VDLLLDTHTWLWWTTGDSQLSTTAINAIADPANRVFFSVVSSWEIAIKFGLGKITLAESPATLIPRLLSSQAITVTDVKLAHTMGVVTLPPHHLDPFDRLLIAQANYEDTTIVTRESAFSAYAVRTLW
jgi:PIN domain nuclease of toxin-antitoxin system